MRPKSYSGQGMGRSQALLCQVNTGHVTSIQYWPLIEQDEELLRARRQETCDGHFIDKIIKCFNFNFSSMSAVPSVKTLLELLIFIFLVQVSLRSLLGHSELTLSFLTLLFIQRNPKILVLFVLSENCALLLLSYVMSTFVLDNSGFGYSSASALTLLSHICEHALRFFCLGALLVSKQLKYKHTVSSEPSE